VRQADKKARQPGAGRGVSWQDPTGSAGAARAPDLSAEQMQKGSSFQAGW